MQRSDDTGEELGDAAQMRDHLQIDLESALPDRDWPAYREHLPAKVHRVITCSGGELVCVMNRRRGSAVGV
jgi:hypothetical protein